MAAGNALIGALAVGLGIDTAAFETGVKTATSKLSSFAKSAGKFAGVAATTLTAGALAAGAALTTLGFKAIDVGDDIGDAAARIGVAASEFQKLQIAGVAAGGSTDLMTTALDKLNQNLGAAHMGSKAMSGVFKELGLDASKLKTADQAFYAIADAIQKVQDPALKAKLSMQLFGKAAGVDMLEVLQKSGKELKSFGDAAASSGRVMSDEMVAKLGDAKLALDNARLAWSQWSTVLGGEAVVAVMDFANNIKPLTDEMGKTWTTISTQLEPSFKALGDALGINNVNGADLAKTWRDSVNPEAKKFAENLGIIVSATADMIKSMREADAFLAKYGMSFGDLGKEISGSFQDDLKTVANIVEFLDSKVKFANANIVLIKGAFRVLGLQIDETRKTIEKFPETMYNLGVNARKAGRDFVDGVVVGMRDAIPNAVENVKQFGGQIIEAFRKRVDAHSPARALMPVGRDIIDGVRVGMEGQSSSLINYARDVAAQAVAAMKQGAKAANDNKDILSFLDVPEKFKNQAEVNSAFQALTESLMTDNDRKLREYTNDLMVLEARAKLYNMSLKERVYWENKLREKYSSQINPISFGDQKDIATIDSGAVADSLKSKTAWIDAYQEQSGKLQQLLAGNISEALKVAATGNWSDYLRSKLNDVLNSAFNELANELGSQLAKVILNNGGGSSGSGGGWMSTITSAISSFFGGGRAGGGGVSPGKFYKVNENTANSEWFATKTPGAIWNPEQLNQIPAANSNNQDISATAYLVLDGKVIDERAFAISAGVTGAGMSAQQQNQQSKRMYSTRGR